jgi:aryl-alcohol dehydrogenase-like predicted oxidoreductase
MKYTQLGNTGLIVSKLSLGTMTFGSGSIEAIYKVDQDLAKHMVDRSLEAGINFFDTADGYADGQSEVILGWALGKRRQDVVIASKVFFRSGESMIRQGLSRRNIIASAQASLKRLNTDYLDVYLAHSYDPHTPLEETLSAMEYLVQQGMVRYVGYSNWNAWQAAKAVGIQHGKSHTPFSVAQMHYSLVGRDLEHEVIPFVQDAGIGTMIWSPLAGGLLSGKYSKATLTDKDNRLSGFDFIPVDKDFAFKVVEELRRIAAKHNASVPQIALAWLLHKLGVSNIIVGASKLAQLEDNLGAINIELSGDEMEFLNKLTAPAAIYPNWFQQFTADPMLKQALT